MNKNDLYMPGLNVSIRDVQMVQLEILIKFDEFCREHNLRYTLFGGTVLGAERHKGFIPWDDDIDVAMPRKDYDKFLKLRHQFPENYFIQNCWIDGSIFPFTKIRKNNTLMLPESNATSKQHQGVWIDVFPLDYSSRNALFKKIHLYLNRLLFVIATSSEKAKVLHSKNIINKSGRYVFYLFNKLFGTEIWMNLFNRNSIKFDNKINDGFYYHLSNGTVVKKQDDFKIDKKDFQSNKEIEFENIYFKCIDNHKDFLERVYGDYMEFPPKSERVPHHGIIQIKL